MKDKILKVISDNSVPKHFCEYGEGIFADINAVDSMAEEIVKLFSIPVVVVSEAELCEHEHETLRQGDGFVYSVCAECGEEL